MIDDNAQNKRINPGVSVNRPRYTVKLIFVIVLALLCKWTTKADECVVIPLAYTEPEATAKEPYYAPEDKAEFYYVRADGTRTDGGERVSGFNRLINRMHGKLFPNQDAAEVIAGESHNAFKDKAEFYYVGADGKRTDGGERVSGFDRLISRMHRKLFPNQNAEVISKHYRTEFVFQQRLEDFDTYTQGLGSTMVAEFEKPINSDSKKVSTSPIYTRSIASARDFFTLQRLDDSESNEIFTQGLSQEEKA